MKKVLHYKTNYLNSSETFIDRLVRNHENFEPAALCYRKRFFTNDLKVYQAPARSFGALLNISAFHLNLTLPYYHKIVKNLKPDVVHSHFGFDAAKIMNLAESRKLPHVVSFYGSDVSRLPQEFGWERRYKKLARLGTLFIAATDLMKEQLIMLGFPEERIRIVRFGLDMKSIEYNNIYMQKPSLMAVGRMVEKKGFEFAIRALANLHKYGIPANLNIYGDGPLMNELVRLTNELRLNEFICFHGYKPVEEVLKAHKNHSVFLAPSVTASDGDMEGLPNTIIEAMAKGIPVVSTYHAAIPEIIVDKQTGFLTKEKDVNALTDILVNILKGDCDLESIREKARKKVEESYNVNQMVHKAEQVYEEAIRLCSQPRHTKKTLL